MNSRLKKALALSFVWLMLAITYVPILVLFVYSFTGAKVLGVWSGFTLELYAKVFTDSQIMEAVRNSLILAGSAALISTVFGTVSAIGIFYLRTWKRKCLDFLTQITMINAEIVTGIAFLLLFVMLKFIPTGWPTLIIAHVFITVPYVIMSVLPRLGQLNPNLYEAGLDLGAGPLKALVKVLIPQLIPAMISGFALAFTLSLDDFVVTKFINGNVSTISTYLYNKLTKKGVQPVLRALSSLIFFAVLIILIVINVVSARRARNAQKKAN